MTVKAPDPRWRVTREMPVTSRGYEYEVTSPVGALFQVLVSKSGKWSMQTDDGCEVRPQERRRITETVAFYVIDATMGESTEVE